MEKPYFWNIHQEYHPKNRLLKYSKSSKISLETLHMLSHIRKMYRKMPPIIYSLLDIEENDDFVLEHDIFGQQCNLPMKDLQVIWQPTSFCVSDGIYQKIKHDLLSSTIDKDYTFLCLFPIYVDMNRKKQALLGHQHEEIFLPSTIPSTKSDLNHLQERFHGMLYKEQALEIGLCEKRRRIYNDLFDELIRIITLQCTERGILLARIKNEYLQWMNTYEELYASGMAYALRQYLCKTEEKQKCDHVIQELEYECQQLQNEIDKESKRFEKITKLLHDDTEQSHEQNLLKTNANILRSTNEILRRDFQNTLNNILSSSIFLGEPINYNKEDD
ncbi:unnamed protein product [Rotaria magnacalcarata]|uniref:Uncharacterized protein n=1 Tax=Rotaria magnacalcarata TaxID=392030 RepID=A0A819HMH3_9BILA|nr:unnamed protein product [Rotaria magnacalcarata]CAF2110551.1 unnamed protein product [Rotaria magnacalcarata]CAF3902323.1 unnamed protein product [Rotaria magnacalcarata]CAF3969574.1 unnamed protein product [Rotaria magnacalcarata]